MTDELITACDFYMDCGLCPFSIREFIDCVVIKIDDNFDELKLFKRNLGGTKRI